MIFKLCEDVLHPFRWSAIVLHALFCDFSSGVVRPKLSYADLFVALEK
jgi:uncharacterized protein YggT (Ycf19 family)